MYTVFHPPQPASTKSYMSFIGKLKQMSFQLFFKSISFYLFLEIRRKGNTPLPDIVAISHTTEIFLYKKFNLLIVFYSKIYEILGKAVCIFPVTLGRVGYQRLFGY